jgi:hypothetical protein
MIIRDYASRSIGIVTTADNRSQTISHGSQVVNGPQAVNGPHPT